MIAITLMIRVHGPSLLLEFVRHRFLRFESVVRGGDQPLVWIPTVGSLLLTEFLSACRIATQPLPNRLALVDAPVDAFVGRTGRSIAGPGDRFLRGGALPTSARPTLDHVLTGIGSSIRTRAVHREVIC